MHSTFLVATFAVLVLAAPIAEAQPILKGSGASCQSWVDGICITSSKREAENNRSPLVLHRPESSPSTENEGEVQPEARSPQPGYVRRPGISRSEKSENEETVEARSPQPGYVRRPGISRSEKSENEDDLSPLEAEPDTVQEGRSDLRRDARPSSVRPGSNGVICFKGHVDPRCGLNRRSMDDPSDDDNHAGIEAIDLPLNERNAEAETFGQSSQLRAAQHVARNSPSHELETRGNFRGSNKRRDDTEVTELINS